MSSITPPIHAVKSGATGKGAADPPAATLLSHAKTPGAGGFRASAGSSSTRLERQVGLGFAIVLNGVRGWADSTLGESATFSFTLQSTAVPTPSASSS